VGGGEIGANPLPSDGRGAYHRPAVYRYSAWARSVSRIERRTWARLKESVLLMSNVSAAAMEGSLCNSRSEVKV